jgi:transposase
VIGPTGAVRVMVATRPVDFRKGAEGLAALVRETMTADPFSGAVYVFRAKRAQQATFYIQFSFCAHFADGEQRFHAMVSRFFARS